jgi:hypothetical protein
VPDRSSNRPVPGSQWLKRQFRTMQASSVNIVTRVGLSEHCGWRWKFNSRKGGSGPLRNQVQCEISRQPAKKKDPQIRPRQWKSWLCAQLFSVVQCFLRSTRSSVADCLVYRPHLNGRHVIWARLGDATRPLLIREIFQLAIYYSLIIIERA